MNYEKQELKELYETFKEHMNKYNFKVYDIEALSKDFLVTTSNYQNREKEFREAINKFIDIGKISYKIEDMRTIVWLTLTL